MLALVAHKNIKLLANFLSEKYNCPDRRATKNMPF
jgi:ribosomal protein S18